MKLKDILNQMVTKLYPNQPGPLSCPNQLEVAKPQFENVDLALAMNAIQEIDG